MSEGRVEAVYWNGASKTELCSPFRRFEVVDITTVDDLLLVSFGVRLPLYPKLLGWLLMGIEIFDVDCHVQLYVFLKELKSESYEIVGEIDIISSPIPTPARLEKGAVGGGCPALGGIGPLKVSGTPGPGGAGPDA